LDLLCARNYEPIELSSVLYQPVENPIGKDHDHIKARVIGPVEAQLWTDISEKGWISDHPEFLDFFLQFGLPLFRPLAEFGVFFPMDRATIRSRQGLWEVPNN
jgi:hypothetical protein